MTDVQREDAERQALIEAMKNHPAFNEAGNVSATGDPINMPVTVPPKVEGSDEHDDHAPSEANNI